MGTMPPLASAVCLAQKCVMIIPRLINNFMIEKRSQSDVLDDQLLTLDLVGIYAKSDHTIRKCPWVLSMKLQWGQNILAVASSNSILINDAKTTDNSHSQNIKIVV